MRVVTSATRVALIDTIASPTGIRLPFEQLVDQLQGAGVDVLLDAAHGPGAVPLDLSALNAAWVTGNCHKWLCTPKGSAFLHVREDKRALRPLVISHGATKPLGGRTRFRLEFDWMGTFDPTPWLCIPAALDLIGGLSTEGWPGVMARNRALAGEARQMISEALDLQPVCTEDSLGPMAAFIIPGEPDPSGDEPLEIRLYDEAQVQVPVIGWPLQNRIYLRVSAHLHNQREDYQRLIAALGPRLKGHVS